jgi:uncharacterized protein DUF4258
MGKTRPLSAAEAQRLVLLILDEGFVDPTYHCRNESMRERNVTMPQLVHALKTGKVLRSPEWDDAHETWKYRVEGVDTEGDGLTAVAMILEEELTLRIITVF